VSRIASALFSRVRHGFCRWDGLLYVLWSAAFTLASGRSFYRTMLADTGGEWSAPLDDVFIHFDYARATALGHPFEWTVGNGYSSGNTSLTYPFVLALGWWLGFVGRELMRWAAIVAAVSVFGTLVAARRLLVEGPRDAWGKVASYLLAPLFLGVGALSWSLWSGMEVAFFLGTWAVALVAWRSLETHADRIESRAWFLGLAGALVVTTRPEAAASLAVFGLSAALHHHRQSLRRAFAILWRSGLPAVCMLGLQAIANRAFTGEWSANGAIVKLAINNPYMTRAEKLDDWIGNAKYAALRNLEYHFSNVDGAYSGRLFGEADGSVFARAGRVFGHASWVGVFPFALALLPLAFGRTRRIATVLWAQIAAWFVIVALNGQVRWQNERYVMPAVAWLLILATMGVSVACRSQAVRTRAATALSLLPMTLVGALVVQVTGVITRPAGSEAVFRFSWLLALAGGMLFALVLHKRAVRVAVVAFCIVLAWDHQIPKMKDQLWFFGRASRNIRDQHLTLGAYLKKEHPKRVLVGDAGAILYESNRPGLDIIGLGGYHHLPFARAGVHGLPASLELLERVPNHDKPDILAIFPTWWGVLPIWFASAEIRRFPVEGNVICGGYEHIVYKADWHTLGTGDRLRTMPVGDSAVRVHVDVADLVSEKQNDYAFDRPANGWTEMHVLPDSADETRDMFDGGRRIKVGAGEHFTARGVTPLLPAHLTVRVAQEAATRVRVRVNGVEVGRLELAANNGWMEAQVPLPADAVVEGMRVELTNEGPADFVDYHAWITQ
jgi:hypothetical protein